MFRVPQLYVFLAHFGRETEAVVAWIRIHACLRSVAKVEFARVKQALWSHEAREFRRLASQVQPHVDRDPVVVEEYGVEVGHIAAVVEAEYAAHGCGGTGNFIPAQSRHHAADQMHHEVSRNAGAIGSPAAPAREVQLV